MAVDSVHIRVGKWLNRRRFSASGGRLALSVRGRFTANNIADAIGGEAPFKDNYALLKKLSEM